MPATPIQITAFQELSRGGGFFNPIGGFYNPPTNPGVLAPLLSTALFTFFDTILSQITAASPFLSSPAPCPNPFPPPTCATVTAYPSVLAGQLQAAMPEYYNAWYSIKGRQESPKEDPLFALTKIPGVSSGSTAGSLMEHSDKYFGHRRTPLPGFSTGACNYYKTGLPPLLVKIASARSVDDRLGPEGLDQTAYPASQTFSIVGVVPGAGGSWSVAGDQTAIFSEGATFAVTGNTGGGNDAYTVLTSVFMLGVTVISVIASQTIPAPSTPNGTIGAVFAKGYFAVTFPLVDIAPFKNASITKLSGNSWYDEMIGMITGAVDEEIDTIINYYTNLGLTPAGATFLATLAIEQANILTELATIVSFATFTTATATITTFVANIAAAYTTVIAALPPPVTERQRIDAQIVQENLRYYGQQFVILNQGSVAAGFYQYKNDPVAYQVLSDCSSPAMLAALNEVIVFP